ncbi:hypothetical protein [Chryseobacterium mucoviscidosis]|uniref:hypothetical protein n=1 Tax=Chryseobacterium mucoviscidosis TaxID=1945581 RepID=UPI000EE3F14D|nr:hypothetical protein [Chryseobacterium sp.]
MMKNLIYLIIFLQFNGLYSQVGQLDSNFGLGDFNYSENEKLQIVNAVDFVSDTLYTAGYSSGFTTGMSFAINKDAFMFRNNKTFVEKYYSIGDNGSRANAIKYYKNYVILAGFSFDKNNKNIALLKINSQTGMVPSYPYPEFSKDGKVFTDFTNDDAANSMDIKDNRIFVAGKAGNQAVVIKYDFYTGRVDRTFNQTGFAKLSVGQKAEITSLKILNSNKILISGVTSNGSQTDFFVARLNENGTLDSSFGNNGITIIDFYGMDDRSNTMKVLSDGKILLGGYCTKTIPTNKDLAIVKLTENGVMDTSYYNTGKMSYDAGTKEDVINFIETAIPQYSNYEVIIALGYKKPNNYKNSLKLSFPLNDFNVSPTFGSTVPNLSNYDDYLVTGYFDPVSSNTDIVVVGNKYCKDYLSYYFSGLPSSFSNINLSYECNNSSQSNTSTSSIKISNDGKIYVLSENKLMRYLSNGLIDNSFAINGVFKEFLISTFDLLPNNEVIAKAHNSGTTNQGNGFIIKIKSTGLIDDNFVFQNYSNMDQYLNAGFVYSPINNKIYSFQPITGGTQFPNGSVLLLRYNLDGSIDSTFASGTQYLILNGGAANNFYDSTLTSFNNNGFAELYATYGSAFLIIKMYNFNGLPMANFGTNGEVQIPQLSTNSYSFIKMITDNSNNIYMIYRFSGSINYPNDRIDVYKYQSNGNLDLTYGNNGVFSYSYTSPFFSNIFFSDAKMQNDNKLLISGERQVQGVQNNGFVLRVSANGSLDTSFGIQNNGIFCDLQDNNPADYFENIKIMSLTHDNKIIIGGVNRNVGSGNAINYTNKIKRLK